MSADLSLRVIEGLPVAEIDGEPRVRDTDLAERLGYQEPRNVRKLIKRHRAEIEPFGPISSRSTVERLERKARGSVNVEIEEFWLNEGQAVTVAQLSRTPKASTARQLLTRVFMAARRGELAAATPTAALSLEAVRELGREIGQAVAVPIVERMDKNFAQTWAQQAEVVTRVSSVEEQVKELRHQQDKLARLRRKEIPDGVKTEHLRCNRLFGGKCACCSIDPVLDADGRRLNPAQYDHFFAAQSPDIDHTWLICGRCHSDFTYGRVSRDQRTAEFGAYQNRRRRLPGAQTKLFN